MAASIYLTIRHLYAQQKYIIENTIECLLYAELMSRRLFGFEAVLSALILSVTKPETNDATIIILTPTMSGG